MLSVWRDDDRCVGVVTDRRAVAARATLLSTGGAAALWERTTNPAGAVGEGMAAAYRAGAALADLEFVQFHPTTLVDSSLLLSEALRGEGALLLDEQGNRFTDELAPRDVVAREIAARGHGAARPARDRPRPLPVAHGEPGRGGLRPCPDADPGRAGGALHRRRRPHRSRRPQRAARPLRRRRVRCDRRARRESPRLELAAGVPRLRSSGGARRARRAGRSGAAARGPGRSRARARDTGAAGVTVARLRPHSRRRRARASARRAARAHAPRRARPRSRARRAAARTSAPTSRPRARRSSGTSSSDQAPRPALETWL